MVLDIKIDEDWRIKSDRYNIILVYQDKNEGYYGTIRACLESFVDKKIRGSDAESIKQLLDELNHLYTLLNQVLQPLQLRVVGLKEVGK